MGRKYLMSWDGEPNFRWRKMVDGKRSPENAVTCEELGLPRSLWTKELSYQAANAWWLKREAELNKPDPVAEAYNHTLGGIPIAKMKEIIEQAAIYKAMIAAGPDAFEGEVSGETVDEIIGIGPLEDSRRIELLGVLGDKVGAASVPVSYRLKHHVEKILDSERARVSSGDVKPETYGEFDVYLHRLMVICEILPETLDVRTINEDTVEDFNNWLRRKHWVKTTRRKVGRFFVRLVRYLWSKKLIELPRNLDAVKFKVRPKAVERFELADVKACLASLTPRQKLYALLGLNCGMLGVDMASLEWSELDQKEWRITRQRTKTEDTSDDVPTVCYRLWPLTAELLKANLSKHETFVLTSMRNTVLWNSYLDPVTGKRKKNDLITQQWARAKSEIALSSFRSIGATIIGDHVQYGRYHHHYLGHSPTSIADKHYVPPSQELFDEIMLYVGRHLSLA